MNEEKQKQIEYIINFLSETEDNRLVTILYEMVKQRQKKN